MRIQESKYKDRPAVILESDSFIATFLPQDGSKLVSLRVRASGKELLVNKEGEEYKVLKYTGDYVSSECSGFDDMFPTVDPYTPSEGFYKGIHYPDHGEVCRITYCARISEQGLLMEAKSKLFSLDYSKIISEAADGGLDITYSIKNNSTEPFPFLWAGHIMLQGEDGMRVLTPFKEKTPVEKMFATKGVSAAELPLDRLSGYVPGKGAAYKFYYLEPMKEGTFGLAYPDGSQLNFTVDAGKIPYLGVWFNNGEFQDLYSITPEPCTVPFDAPDRAAKRGYRSVIPAKSIFSFKLHIAWEPHNEGSYE